MRGDYKQADYGKVILPFTVLCRLDCVLEPSKQKVLDFIENKAKATKLKNLEPVLNKTAGLSFHNTSKYPHVPDAWIDESKTVKGNEISFTRYFYRYKPLRSLAEIRADILALEKETEGMILEVLNG